MDEDDLGYYDFGYGDYDFSAPDFGDFDFGDLDFGGLNFDDVDLSGLDELNLDDLQNIDLDTIDFGSDFDLGAYEDMAPAPVDFGSNFDLGAYEDMAPETDWQALYNQGLSPEEVAARESYMSDLSQYNQNFGGADTSQYMDEFQSNLKDIYENRGGFTSQWQDVGIGGAKVMVMDDGTGIRFNPITGSHEKLTTTQVGDMIRKGELNTYKSGYNTATGGDRHAPGGGTSVVLKDGSKGTLMPGGRVIDSSGTVIGDSKDVASKVTTDGTGRTTTTSTSGQGTDWMKLLLALAAMAAMRDKGTPGSAVIPSLRAERSQTPYAQTMQQPGYRPGQGGIQYFGPTIYRAAGGGIAALDAAGGRLLQGPGDGVSDDIVAQIGDNQPARLADGEYVLDARTVSEIGNGSTDAGAKKIAQMVERIHSERRAAKRGEPSNADKHLLA